MDERFSLLSIVVADMREALMISFCMAVNKESCPSLEPAWCYTSFRFVGMNTSK